jgi:hypothetical protein
MEPIELPVACTLNAADQSEQVQRWTRLIETAALARSHTPGGIELRFADPDDDIREELAALVAVERECCAWAHWTIRTAPGGDLVLQATAATEQGAAALRAMFS